LQKRLTNFENKGRAGDAGVLRSIAAGGTLTLQRRFPDLEPQHPLKLCRQCGTEAETALHRFWTCPCIPELYGHSSEVGTDATDEEKLEVETYKATIEKTQSLKQDAIVGCTTRDQQCFYLRGLIPQGWTTCSEPHQVVEKRFGQALEAEPACVEHIFVDGSGSTSDPRLRRCGWAVAWIDFGPCSGDTYLEAKVLGAIQGNMDMDSQSVPAAELTAVLQALRATRGDVTIWSDCWFVVQGFANARWRLEVCQHFDLWQRIHANCEGRRVTVRWVKAHAKVVHLETGQLAPWQIIGNEVVDTLAKAAADFVPVSPSHVRYLFGLEGKASLIRKRLLAIQKWHLQQVDNFVEEDEQAQALQHVARQIKKLVSAETKEATKRSRQEAEQERTVATQGHPTHTIVEYRGYLVCTKCGAKTGSARPTLRALRRKCNNSATTPYFKGVLGKLSGGKPLDR